MDGRRPILSYDDISSPSTWAPPRRENGASNDQDTGRTPKRGRWSHGTNHATRQRPQAHWDDPQELAGSVSYDVIESSSTPHSSSQNEPLPSSKDANDDTHSTSSPFPTSQRKGKKRSRPKRYDPVSLADHNAWDDTGLVEAWDAANEEYERIHGPGKSWKDEPIHKPTINSVSWYGKITSSIPSTVNGVDNDDVEEEAEIFEETGDISFDVDMSAIDAHQDGVQAAAGTMSSLPPDDSKAYSPEESFQQALNASYWLGYWTAMHNRQLRTPPASVRKASQSVEETAEE